MAIKFKQYKISDMIKSLQEQKNKHGDLFIEMSKDDEGNGFRPIGEYISETKDKIEADVPYAISDNKLIIYPCE